MNNSIADCERKGEYGGIEVLEAAASICGRLK